LKSILHTTRQGGAIVSRSLSRRQAILLGVVILAGLVLGGGGIFLIGSRAWFGGDRFHVRAGFKAIHGVEVGTRVRVNGITDAGEVVAITPPATPEGDIVLRLRLDGRYRAMVRADAVVQIVSDGVIGGKVVEINSGRNEADPVADDALLASRPTRQASELIDQAGTVLQDLHQGGKTVLKDLHDGEGEVGKRMAAMMDNISAAANSFSRTSDAIRKMPGIRSYDTDVEGILVRPDCKRTRTTVAERELFEPHSAILTPAGEKRLDGLVGDLKTQLAPKGSELVVVATADPKGPLTPASARTLTQKQGDVVLDYLKSRHAVQRFGSGWWPWRDVSARGLGIDPYPGEENDTTQPAARVELVVFVPQK
jgi:phospholipid/cholesterol/gamma-HCH transport system substrate-binding protein